ncbi:hypothetical protein Aph01nite_48940 [Acrocarpospora phusangensis]|uniref:FtsX extracellular domain-containing protein n=1 Tax=Acrocarpospora phusangensis TaxID=1070424 RepID=A0A919UM34_9ACTN|nr:hypothetical protein [Acrocarpospora phusangensis]GIH26584.1 hypothetical protein Aph01nite_48940 [Acrocarpospora phusangensis]
METADAEELASADRADGGWVRRHLTALVAVGIVGVILAAGWIPRLGGSEPVPTPAPAPEVDLADGIAGEVPGMSPLPEDWPVQDRFAVQMCTKSTLTVPACGGRESVLEDADAILAQARKLRVSRLGYVDGKVLSRRRLEAVGADSLPVTEPVPEGDEKYFTGSVPRASALDAVIRKFSGMSGVARVIRVPVDFWEEHADIRVELCGRQGCPGRGPATEEERSAILARVETLLSAEAVYVEDTAHLRKTFAAMYAGDAERRFAAREPYGDSVYVKLSNFSPGDAIRLLGKPEGMRGAATVRPHFPDWRNEFR